MQKHYTDEELVTMIMSNDPLQMHKVVNFLYHTYYESMAVWLKPLPPKVECIDIFAPKLRSLILNIQTGKTVIGQQATIKTNLYAYCGNGKKNEWRSYYRQNNLIEKLPPLKKVEKENALTNIMKNQQNAFVASLISKMKKNCQKSLTKFYYKDKSHREIADEMQFKSEQQSRNLLSKCRKKLREMILSRSDWKDFLRP